ncbi:MAG: type II toxin-antitoxin system VapC family toxin [Nitrospirae bacterium]|nr:type II toxin-antitoxin system VapC family toxin [Nitrospirota bacterium]
MKRVLVDTDILIDFLRGREKAKSYLASILEDSTIYCSAITVAEIYAGMKEHEREKTVEFLDSLDIVDVNREIAEKAGIYKRDEKKQYLDLDDCIIAATAFVRESILATGNAKHYPMEDIKKKVIK